MRFIKKILVLIGVLLLAGIFIKVFQAFTYVSEHEKAREPENKEEFNLKDDVLSDKNPKFDPTLVDSRLFEGWQVNQSAAVIKLDILSAHPRTGMDVLHPSYADIIKKRGFPSVNLIDGAAKQFDDGLYAAVDLAVFRGEAVTGVSLPQFIESVFHKLPEPSPARPFLAGALSLVGKQEKLNEPQSAAQNKHLAEFEMNATNSKPAGFYTWNEELKQVWRFCRYLQKEFDSRDISIPADFAKVLSKEPKLRKDYTVLLSFYSRLTNPDICLPADALADGSSDLSSLAKTHNARHVSVAILPPATSRETELFEKLFPEGLPPGANLMNELIRNILSGTVTLAPTEQDGWYQWQVHALEVLLLPSKAAEKEKLLLTAKYKKRLLEAFMVLITKRRETHLKNLAIARSLSASGSDFEMPKTFYPRLRLEPAATFYLRTARAYAFVENLLKSFIKPEILKKLYGIRSNGLRTLPLQEELETVKNRFYGFYVLSCEDIGMKPQFLPGEEVNQDLCRLAAVKWLDQIPTDEDLSADTRFAVPIYQDSQATRYWLTLGVRSAILSISYAKPPKIRPAGEKGEWQDIPKEVEIIGQTREIPVEDFAEIGLKGHVSLSRDEWRSICDKYKTKAAILEALNERFNK